MEKTPEYMKAREKAIRYIMYKMRTSYEVSNKLKDLEVAAEIIDSIVNDLIRLEYINDEEYVKKFIESQKKLKKTSKSMIKLKLKNKGIEESLIEKFLKDFDEEDAIKKILQKKGFTKAMEYDEKNKIKAFCLRKGFSLAEVNRVMRDFEE